MSRNPDTIVQELHAEFKFLTKQPSSDSTCRSRARVNFVRRAVFVVQSVTFSMTDPPQRDA